MANQIKIPVNERVWTVESTPDTPLLYVLLDEMNLTQLASAWRNTR